MIAAEKKGGLALLSVNITPFEWASPMTLRSRRSEGFEKLEAEIQKEKAEALGRAGERVEKALAAVREIRQIIWTLGRQLVEGSKSKPWLDRTSLRREFNRRIIEYNRLRDRAQTFYHYLVVQREAVGFRRHPDVERQYPLPGRLDGDQVLRELRQGSPSSPGDGRGDRSS